MTNPFKWLRSELNKFTHWWYTGAWLKDAEKAEAWWTKVETKDIDPTVKVLYDVFVLHSSGVDDPSKWEAWAVEAEKILKVAFNIAEDLNGK